MQHSMMEKRIHSFTFLVFPALLVFLQMAAISLPQQAVAANAYVGPNGQIYMGDSLPRELLDKGYVPMGSRRESLYPTHGKFKDFMWKVSSSTTTVYILGSVHTARSNVYPLPDGIENAFDGCSVLAVEADLNPGKLMRNAVDITREILRGITYPGGDTIENHISAHTYALAKARLETFGVSMDQAKYFRPWVLASMVEGLSDMGEGFSVNYGIDKHFMDEAAGKKRIVELEGIAFQINLFNNLSGKEEEAMLLGTLNEKQGELKTLLSYWAVGNAARINALIYGDIEKNPDMASFYKKFLWDRNRGMAEKIEKFLDGREKVFVVVGAAHLVGDKGVLSLLRQKGYKVEQMESEARPASF